MTRGNQKLLSSDNQTILFDRINNITERLEMRINRNNDIIHMRGKRKFHPVMLEELLHFSRNQGNIYIGIIAALNLLRDDFPWLYDSGKDLLNIIKSEDSFDIKQHALSEFKEFIEFTFHNPIFTIEGNKDEYMILRDYTMILSEYFERIMMDREEFRKQPLNDNEQRNIRRKTSQGPQKE